ncbi:MAG: chromosome segregation protein SMC [Lachnospiraceae bacterium]|nr:chromosome segregation protein SMC [Lachnospiraceae bacterium]
MYLKSIELQGFKSFANKMRFEFNEGVTGIVGPNGSGKSNIADAVRWVLGEQSAKQLRGASMQDVIFAGTENRKPVSFAYVALTLDNSDHKLPLDYEEVVVSRRVFRSGESEYLLNGSPCRLRDIHELFYDTGIGKEGYSIIGQGQIDKILSGKPEERRELFDEAAGIVKFKKRKWVAQKKLENERLNLVRVTDILTELEKQVGPLAKQSEKARQYLKLKEELKGYDIRVFQAEAELLKENLAGVSEKRTVAGDELEAARNRSLQLKNYFEAAMEEGKQLDREIEQVQASRTETGIFCESLEGQIKVFEEQIHTEEAGEAHVKSRMADIEKEREARRKERETFLEQKARINEQMDQADEELGRAEERLKTSEGRIEEWKAAIRQKQQEVIRGLNEKASLGAKKQRYDTLLEQANVRKSEIQERMIRMKSSEEDQKAVVSEWEEKAAELTAGLSAWRLREEEAVKALAKAGQAVEESRRLLSGARQEENQSRIRYDALQNLAERYEGFGNSTRKLMEEKKNHPGIIGTVADLIETEARYETAVETALGGAIQNIVTDTEDTAKTCVRFLKSNRYGRATFLPLDSIQSREFRQKEALKEPGVIGLGSDLLRIRPEYRNLARYLLGNVVVTDTMDHALSLARKFRYELRIVTLDGELLNRGGSITGGAYKNSSNLLGRRRELESLKKTCETAKEACARAEQGLKEAEAVAEQEAEKTERIREEQRSAEVLLASAEASLKSAREKSQDVLKGYDDLVREARMIAEQVGEVQKNRQVLETQAKEWEEAGSRLEEEIVSCNRKQEEEQKQQEILNRELSEKKLTFAGLSQKDAFLLENLVRTGKELEKLEQEKLSLTEKIKTSHASAEEKKLQIQDVKMQIGYQRKQMEELDQMIENRTAKRSICSANQKRYVDEREKLAESIHQLDKEVYRLDHQREKLEEQREARIQYLWTEYEITPSDIHLEEEEAPDLPSMKKAIAGIRNEIRELGSVNVNAIEDYKEVFERYTFLRGQHEDLQKAEESLLKIIEELDEGMRRQFAEKFAEIQKEFDKVFKELFGGGKATLELVDSEDVLEAGIRITAQPPGKKLVNMMQMSGGEKALTAISILFAIQNLKPSPFCLLDEIEAALDDANVARFAEYLKKLQKNSQFITITHRRGTMLAADRLYGITMQEKGISTLVTVNLADE